MSNHYLLYWSLTKKEIAEPNFSQYPLDHAAGEQLWKVKADDVLWVVTLETVSRLLLLGRMIVDRVVDQATAESLFRHEIYQGTYHAIPKTGTVEPMRKLDMSQLAPSLRFHSQTGKDRLSAQNSRFSPMQLRAMRHLTEASAELLNGFWYGEQFFIQDATEIIETIEDEAVYQEGRIIVKTRQERQRSQMLIQQAKQSFKSQHGRLFCEACGFDFLVKYGELGEGYIEAHHTVPISQIAENSETSMDDLVMLCSNCHRIVHRKTPPLRIDELKQLVNKK